MVLHATKQYFLSIYCQKKYKNTIACVFMFLVYALFSCILLVNVAIAQTESDIQNREIRKIIHSSEAVLSELVHYSAYGKSIINRIRNAKALILVPSLYKVGFLLGAEAGQGIMMARSEEGLWSYPTFIKIKSGSFGFQFGYQESQLLLLILTSTGLNNVLKHSVTLGGEISAAAGPVGEGYQAATSTDLGADIISYMSASGAFLGASLEGSFLAPANELTKKYYGDDNANSTAVMLDGLYANPHADKLRQMIQNISDQ